MSKVNELEKRHKRVESEVEKAKERLQKQQEIVTKKENELKQLEAEIVSAFLVENELTLTDLKSLLPGQQASPTSLSTATTQSTDVGGNDHA